MRACLVIVLAACGGAAVSPVPPPVDEPAAAPRVVVSPLATSTFPVPPQQTAAWTSRSPDRALAGATAKLFEQGVADPRGCAYRHVELAIGSVWGNGETAKLRGWVLPAQRGGATWAIGWNGLVYPVVSAGAPADLRADVTAMLAAARAARAAYEAEHPGSKYHRFQTTAEGYNASHESVTGVKALLLLRLGEDELAADVWRELAVDDSDHPDPYLLLASEWTWSLFDRAITAHMRGDIALAVGTVRPLVAIEPLVEAEAERRKIKRHADKAPYLPALAPLRALAEDIERRARDPRAPLPDAAALAQLAPADRVRVLIDHLDQVAARQWGQPGGVDLASDPIVAALMAEGTAAVEPLIEVIEIDTRLTRSVSFHRDFKRHRSVIGVHEAAYVAVAGILEASFFRAGSTGDNLTQHGMEGRRKVADAIRAYWAQWKSVPLEERWYRTLADDGAKPEDWLDAARKITLPTNVRVHPSSNVFTSTTTTSAPTPPGMRGESLRGHGAPSVSTLFERRIRGAGLELAAPLAIAYGHWDPGGAAATLRDQMTRAIAASKGTPGNQKYGRAIVAIAELRAASGDKRALDDYAAWIRTTGPSDDGWQDKELFEPMWKYATHPPIAAASEAVFADGAPWMPLLALSQSSTSYRRAELIATDLVATSGFNKHLARALADRRVAGTLTMKSATSAEIVMLAGWQTGVDPSKDPLAPPVKSTVDIRVCDHYAWVLSRATGAPPFQLYWPLADRDKAIAAHLARLPSLRAK